MNAGKFAVVLLAMFLGEIAARSDESSPRTATNAVATNQIVATGMPLTNKALFVISKLRGVEPSKVKLQPGRRPAGLFEIDITEVPDGKHEAQELSKELGADATVIFEHVSGDGVTRTNWSFREGKGRKVIAPAGPTGLGPNGKRLYVWPQSSVRLTAPAGVRVRTKENE